jgi:regulator of RNase E activity RraA
VSATPARPGDGDELRRGLADLLATEDASCLVADALLRLGVGGTVGVPGVIPVGHLPRACGPAFTVRYETASPVDGQATPPGGASFNFGALFRQARPGDVALFETPATVGEAVLGSQAISWAGRFGVTGCVVNGCVRDVEAIHSARMPVWARQIAPMAGRGRLVQAEVGGQVSLGGLTVSAGDVVVADANGVAIVPAARFGEVAQIVAEIRQAEAAAAQSMDATTARPRHTAQA